MSETPATEPTPKVEEAEEPGAYDTRPLPDEQPEDDLAVADEGTPLERPYAEGDDSYGDDMEDNVVEGPTP